MEKLTKLTAQQLADVKKEIAISRAKVSKELKSKFPNRTIVRLSTNHISHLNYMVQYGWNSPKLG